MNGQLEKQILEDEGNEMIEMVSKGGMNQSIKFLTDRLEKIVNLVTDKVFSRISEQIKIDRIEADVEFPESQKVHGDVNVVFPKMQKVEGTVTAEVQFPETQKIAGEVKAEVKFPTIQKIFGKVEALVKFPAIQKITGKVDVDFPDTQKIEGKVKTDIPKISTGKFEVVPIVFTDGNKIIAFPGSAPVHGDGRLHAAIRDLTSAVKTQSVFYSDQVIITVSGNAKTLHSAADTKTVVVQALKDNRGIIYISSDGANDFELQAGQSVTVVIDNLNKIQISGSYVNDGVCYVAS